MELTSNYSSGGLTRFGASTKKLLSEASLPRVSVVLPSYNHAKFVVKMMDSVVEQNYPNIELLVVDDGSSDDSTKVIESWIDKNQEKLHIEFRSRKNRGLSNTLNELIEMATGDIIAGASSDDWFLPNSIHSRVRYLMSNPDKLAVFSDFKVVNMFGDLVCESGITDFFHGDKKLLKSADGMKTQFLRRFCIAGPVLMFRKSMIDHAGGFDESFAVEDWDFYLRMAGQEVVGFLDVPVAAYRWDFSKVFPPATIESLSYRATVLERHRKNYQDENLKYIDRRLRGIAWRQMKIRIKETIKSFSRKRIS